MRRIDRRPGLGSAFVAVTIALIGVAALSRFGTQTHSVPLAHNAPEAYRLVHAIGNDETIVAEGLSKHDCEARKKDNIAVAETLGIHSERLGIGSITCLPESLFRN